MEITGGTEVCMYGIVKNIWMGLHLSSRGGKTRRGVAPPSVLCQFGRQLSMPADLLQSCHQFIDLLIKQVILINLTSTQVYIISLTCQLSMTQ